MSEDEKNDGVEQDALMEKYGITSSTKTLYKYKQYQYDNLKDCLAYAELESKRGDAGGASQAAG